MSTYYCIADGYSHRESSMIGREHHPLKVEEDFLSPFKVAVGVSLVIAGTSKNRGDTETILGIWDAENFNNQFDSDPIDQLREWNRIGLIGRTRHSGKTWYELLANKGTAGAKPTSPERFGLLMRKYADWYGRIEGLEVPQGFSI